jgi:hypothetical protein
MLSPRPLLFFPFFFSLSLSLSLDFQTTTATRKPHSGATALLWMMWRDEIDDWPPVSASAFPTAIPASNRIASIY